MLKLFYKCYSFLGPKAGLEHWMLFAHFELQLHSAMLAKFWNFFPELPNSRSSGEIHLITEIESKVFRWFKFTLKTPYSIVCGKLQLAI